MSNQKILVINTGHAADFGHKEFKSVTEMETFLRDIDEVMDVSTDLKFFVGEERCLSTIKGRATNQYKLSAAGCGCQKQ